MNSDDTNNTDDSASTPEFSFTEAAPMRLMTQVDFPEGTEDIIFWAGTTIDWMLAGPDICDTLAIAVRSTQEKLRKAMDEDDNK